MRGWSETRDRLLRVLEILGFDIVHRVVEESRADACDRVGPIPAESQNVYEVDVSLEKRDREDLRPFLHGDAPEILVEKRARGRVAR